MIGKIVKHTRYGRGEVRACEQSYLKIVFEDAGDEKEFAYPLAFERFLKFEDADCQAAAEAQIAEIRRESSRRNEAQALVIRQRELAMLEAHREEQKAKRAAAAKKAAATRASRRKTENN